MVTTGIDRLHLTFSIKYAPEMLVSTLFESLTLEKHFRRVDNTLSKTRSKAGQKISWYRTSYYLETAAGDTLIAVHTDPTSQYGKRNLVQVHGLTFSNSALNALRPLNLDKLLNGALDMDAAVSAMDLYLDATDGEVPIDKIRVQSLPSNYRAYIRSPFIRDKKHTRTLPRPVGDSSIYYGGTGNACQILLYSKHLDPHQRIYSEDNPLKFPWVRFELRLRKATAKRQGSRLLWLLAGPVWPEDQHSIGQAVADLFSKYFNFVEPTRSRANRCPVQAWWSDLLSAACL
ncbi:replication initiation factor domain-containing protein [Geomonas nitrogeniifigens]|uniref:Replication initiation factor domain-containing protein n=1 Tax=Geomonas diazotrophica TaxID=2843197 RepID=A0ABX8JG84_9BACT|nr:replication initiation factor domain-containing protein [Geomonas nitrogeniifigens]QWV96996.1 replication initiation factor domain-containing protein [Geomonas nitrogeniifigens]